MILASTAVLFLLAQQPRLVAEIFEPGAKTVVSSVGLDAAGNLYVGGENRWAHLWTTADRGKSWTAVASPSGYEFRSVVPDPEQPLTLYGVETTRGILKSADGGKTWRVLRRSGGTIAVDAGDRRIVMALDDDGGLLRSVDGGESWRLVFELEGGISLQIDPSGTGVAVVTTSSSSVWISRDRGASWQTRTAPEFLQEVVFHPHRPGSVFGRNGGALYRSDDLERWSQIATPGGSSDSLYPDPLVPGRLWLTGTAGIYRSEDEGRSWVFSRAGEVGSINGCGIVVVRYHEGMSYFDAQQWVDTTYDLTGVRFGAGCVGYGLRASPRTGFVAKYSAQAKLLWKHSSWLQVGAMAVGLNGDTAAVSAFRTGSWVEFRDTTGSLLAKSGANGSPYSPIPMVFDQHGDLHFSQPFDLRRYISKVRRDGSGVYSKLYLRTYLLGVDGLDRAVIADPEGVWILNETGDKLAKLLDVPGVSGLWFASNGDFTVGGADWVARFESDTWRLLWRTSGVAAIGPFGDGFLVNDRGQSQTVFLDRNGERREAPIQAQGLQMITAIPGGGLLLLSQRDLNAAVVVERLDP